MKEIWKYEIPVEDYPKIEMQVDAVILKFDAQYEKPCIWCLVDTEAGRETRKFRFAGTGHEITESMDKLNFIDTCQLHDEQLIFHLFEIIGQKR